MAHLVQKLYRCKGKLLKLYNIKFSSLPATNRLSVFCTRGNVNVSNLSKQNFQYAVSSLNTLLVRSEGRFGVGHFWDRSICISYRRLCYQVPSYKERSGGNDDDRGVEQKHRNIHHKHVRSSAKREDVIKDHEIPVVKAEIPDEADTFGTLSQGKQRERYGPSIFDTSELEEEEENWIHRSQVKNTPYWYASQMKKLIKENKLAEAIDMLETRMLKEDRVQPNEHVYNTLIGSCARAGYTTKAFKLYNRMKQRGLQPLTNTYTALFNACAESPWPQTDGIQRLRKLHGQLLDKGVQINLISSHAMIKAYGKCGDLQSASELFANLLQTGTATAKSFNLLLFACISNKESGMTYAVEFWRQMVAFGIPPDNHTHNLLLRIVRDCGIGDSEWANQILLKEMEPAQSKQLPAVYGKKGRKTMKPLRNNKDGKRLTEKQQEAMVVVDLIPVTNLHIGDESGYKHSYELETETDLSLEGEDWLEKERGSFVEGMELQGSRSRRIHQSVSQGYFERNQRSSSSGRKQLNWRNNTKEFDEILEDMPPSLNPSKSDKHVLTVQGKDMDVKPVNQTSLTRSVDYLPNLLDPKVDLSSVVSISHVKEPSEKLALFGGPKGFLDSMASFKIKPDSKTLTLLAEIVPMETKEEEVLFEAVRNYEVAVDVDFYNAVIRRRTKRGSLKDAKSVLKEIVNQGLFPNMRTFVNIATGCKTEEDGMQLIKDIEATGLKPIPMFYSVLISNARIKKDYVYLRRLMQQMYEDKVIVNDMILSELEMVMNHGKVRGNLRLMALSKDKQQKLNDFRAHYKNWLKLMKAEEPIDDHPYAKFRTVKRDEHPGQDDER